MMRPSVFVLCILLAACGTRERGAQPAPLRSVSVGGETIAAAEATPSKERSGDPPSIRELFRFGKYDEILALYGRDFRPGERLPGTDTVQSRSDEARGISEAAATESGAEDEPPGAQGALSRGIWTPIEQRLIARAFALRGHYEEALIILRAAYANEGDRHALVDQAAILFELGRDDEARVPLEAVIRDYNRRAIAPDDADSIFAVAKAARLLGSARDANRALHEAARLKPRDDEIELAWSELFLEAHAHEEAKRGIGGILRRSPEHAEARALLAEVYLAEGKPSRLVREEAERAILSDPRCLRAQRLLASLAIARRDEADALERIERLEAQTHRSIDSLMLRGGLAFLTDQRARYEAIEREVAEMNPRPVRFYEFIAELVELDHRYDEAAALSARALEMSPNDGRARARYGMNLVRLGREDEGRTQLRAAVALDPFNRRVHQLLELYESRIDRDYVMLERPPFRIRAHRVEAAAIERFVLPFLESALRTLESRYGRTIAAPIQIEFYRDPRDASIRAAGVPDLPFQAICFGKVITSVSPSVGGFDWGQIVWHELAHVFHLQMSRGRAPRWLMEGLAEREAMISPKAFKRPLAQRIHAFISSRAIPPLDDFDALFSETRVMEELIVSYGLSTLAVDFLEEEYGVRKLVALLRGFGEGRRFSELVEAELGVDARALNDAFRAYLASLYRQREGRYEPDFEWVESEPSAHVAVAPTPERLAKEAAILFREGHPVQASALAQRALDADPKRFDALFILGKLSPQRDRALALFKAIIQQRESVGVRLELARLHTESGEFDRALAHLERVRELDPERPEAYQRIAQIASVRRRPKEEIAALEELMSLEPHSVGVAFRLIRRLFETGDHPRLLLAAEDARFTALFDPRVHLYRLIAAVHLREREMVREALADLEVLPGAIDGELYREALEALDRAGYRPERQGLERLFMRPRHRR